MKTWNELGIDIGRKTSGNLKTRCPKCEGKYDLSVNLDEMVYKCHKPSCAWKGTLKEKEVREEKTYKLPVFKNDTRLSDEVVKWFQGRGISQETLLRVKITNGPEWMPQKNAKVNTIQFNYFREGQLVNVKYRDGAKNFKLVSGAELILYNLDSIKGEKEFTICEGEIDCLSFIEAGITKVVSVPNGASKGKAALEYITNCYQYFEKAERVYIAVDNDEAGSFLRDELCRRLGKDICYVVSYPDGMKDANEVLTYKGVEAVRELLTNAKGLPLEDVLYLNMVRSQMLLEFKNGKQRGTTTYFKSIDPHFTWKKGQVTLMNGIPNHGKTTLMLQLMLIKSICEGDKWGVFSPENFPPNEFYDELIQTYIGKPTDPIFGAKQMSQQEYEQGMDFINEHFYYLYPEKESPTPEYINARFKEMVIKHGVTGCLIDPFNQLDNDMSKAGRDDLYISKFLTEEKRFALKHDIYKIIIAHPSKLQKLKEGGYAVPDPYDLHGGSMWNNKLDNILCTHRPNYWNDKTDTMVEFHSQKIKKQALVGIPGTVTLSFHRFSNRYLENGVSPFELIGTNRHLPEEQRDHPAQKVASVFDINNLPDSRFEVPETRTVDF